MLGFGIKRMVIDDVPVAVSDPARTFLDLLDRSEHLLGFQETRTILHDNIGHRLSAKRLVDYARRWPKTSTIRRLGVLLEMEGISEDTLTPLSQRLRGSASDAVLEPGGSRRGPVHPRFRVILNESSASSGTTA
jgi:predicted transcriptional regulator of viral defense system